MVLHEDSRQQVYKHENIKKYCNRHGIEIIRTKLLVGDYMSLDNPRLIIDRKQNLSELCSNVCQGHERFTNEIKRAIDNEIRLVFLVEHGSDITCLEDVIFWENPRGLRRTKSAGRWVTVKTKATSGETL